MIGLIVLIVAAVYLAMLVWATRAAYRWARRSGWSKGKCWAAAAGGFLAVYLPVFWDWLPTVVAHKYYCVTEAKFEVYKSVDQWKKDNAGILPTLRYDPRALVTTVGDYRRFPLNQRVATESRTVDLFLSIERLEGRLLDLGNGEILARYADVRSGPKESGIVWKFWLQRSACKAIETGRSPVSLYASLENGYEFGKERRYDFGGSR